MNQFLGKHIAEQVRIEMATLSEVSEELGDNFGDLGLLLRHPWLAPSDLWPQVIAPVLQDPGHRNESQGESFRERYLGDFVVISFRSEKSRF